ncbi:restriction endonuclease [Bacteroidia bacterium]|nr:restriction endonuclease [Bacteroidia bacterium]
MKKVAVKEFQLDRNFMNCHIAGFAHKDGYRVVDELNVGTMLDIFAEPNNPFDAYAVSIWYHDTQLGYIPSGKNEIISKMLQFGHSDIFEVVINSKKTDAHPEQQFHISIKISDGR